MKHKKEQLNMNKRGGKYLGEGAYGCVYRPNIISSNTGRSDNLISKIVDKKHINSEFEFVKTLRLDEIDPEQNYFIYPKKNENIESIDIDNDNNLEDCDIIDDRMKTDLNELNKNYINIILDYGGIDLYKYNISDNINKIDDILEKYYNLIKSVLVLNKNGIIHRDIKPANILFNGNKMRLIDFGLATKIKDINNIEHTQFADTKYGYWPYDYRVILNNNFFVPKSGEKVNEFDQRIMIDIQNYFIKSYSPTINKKLWVKLAEQNYFFIRGFITGRYTYEDMVRQAYDKFDVFSLGVVLLDQYNRIKDKDDPDDILPEFYEFIEQLVHGNPFKRLDIKTACINYLDLLVNNNLITEAQYRDEMEDIEIITAGQSAGSKKRSKKTSKKSSKRTQRRSLKRTSKKISKKSPKRTSKRSPKRMSKRKSRN